MIRDYNKYIVIKTEDVREVLDEGDRRMLDHMLEKIKRYRVGEHKPAFNKYVVVNEDQPYAEIVWGIIAMIEDLRDSGRLKR